MARRFKGLGALFIGGFSVGMRVAIYVPMLVPGSGPTLGYVGDSSRIFSLSDAILIFCDGGCSRNAGAKLNHIYAW